MDENSSYEGVSHPLSNNRNHMWAASDDIQGEQLVGYTYKRFNFLFGGAYQLSLGDAFIGYLDRPFDENQLRPVQVIPTGTPFNLLQIRSVWLLVKIASTPTLNPTSLAFSKVIIAARS